MADTNVLGILALLLIGGAAYLIWTRRSRPSDQTSEVLPVERGRDRTSDTMPPTLRPNSEIPAKMAAKKEAMARASGKPPPASERKVPSARPPQPAAQSKPPAQAKVPSVAPAPASPKDAVVKDAPPPAARAAEPAPVAKRAETPTAKEKPAALPRISKNDEEDDVELTRVGRQQEPAAIRPLVEKIVFDEGADTPAEGEAVSALVYAVAQTDTGKRRKENQDAYLLVDQESLFIVADGMGGHKGGQAASKLAVTTIGKAFDRKNFEAAAHENLAVEASELARAVQMANTAIFNEAKGNRELEGMGTTVVAARFTANRRRLYIAHVGDSRCYRIRNGVMRQMTTDHTMADYGVTGPEGAHLSRAVGVWPTVPIDVVMATPEVGDLYLICSDGLTKMLSEGTISTQIIHEEDPKAAVSRLVFFANAHGGKDNVTVVLLRIVPPGWTPPRTSLPPPAPSA